MSENPIDSGDGIENKNSTLSEEPVKTPSLIVKEGAKEVDLQTLYKSGGKDLSLSIHLMANDKKEVATVKKKIYDLDFDWSKYTYAIQSEKFITLKDGSTHYFHDVNDSSGGLHLGKTHPDLSGKDSESLKLVTQKRNLRAIWGIDNIPLIMLLIMSIIIVVALVAVFYIYGDDQSTHKTLESYLPKVSQSTTVTHFLLGVGIYK